MKLLSKSAAVQTGFPLRSHWAKMSGAGCVGRPVSPKCRVPWNFTDRGDPLPWELYDLRSDFSQAHDLASQNPTKVDELKQFYFEEAQRNQVYPKGGPGRGGIGPMLPNDAASTQKTWTFRPGAERVPAKFAPRLGANLHHLLAEIETGKEKANGIIFAQGGRKGGIVLFAKGGRVILELAPISVAPARSALLRLEASLPKGKSTVEATFTRLSEAAQPGLPEENLVRAASEVNHSFDITLVVNGKPVGPSRFETGEFNAVSFGGNARNPIGSAVSIGAYPSAPISRDEAATRPFNGLIHHVTFRAD